MIKTDFSTETLLSYKLSFNKIELPKNENELTELTSEFKKKIMELTNSGNYKSANELKEVFSKIKNGLSSFLNLGNSKPSVLSESENSKDLKNEGINENIQRKESSELQDEADFIKSKKIKIEKTEQDASILIDIPENENKYEKIKNESEISDLFGSSYLTSSQIGLKNVNFEGFGCTLKINQKNALELLKSIDIENSLKSLVAFGQITYNINSIKNENHFIFTATLTIKNQPNSFKSPAFKSQNERFILCKTKRWIVKKYLKSINGNKNISIVFCDEENFLEYFQSSLDELCEHRKAKDGWMKKEKEKEEIEKNVQTLENEIIHLKEILENYDKKETSSDLESIKEKNLKEALDQINKMKDDLQKGKNITDEKEKEITNLRSELLEKDTKIKELENKLSEVKKSLEEKAKIPNEIQKEIKEKERQIENLNNEMSNNSGIKPLDKSEIDSSKENTLDGLINKFYDNLEELNKVKTRFVDENGNIRLLTPKKAKTALWKHRKYSEESSCFLFVDNAGKPLYKVKCIEDMRIVGQSTTEYSILWADGVRTWEPAKNIAPELVKEFNTRKKKKKQSKNK